MIDKLKCIDKRILIGAVIFIVVVMVLGIWWIGGCMRGDDNDTQVSDSIDDTSAAENTTVPESSQAEAEEFTTITYENDSEDPQIQGGSTDTAPGTGAQVNISQQDSLSSQASAAVGIDVSRYQGTIDWKSVADSGIEFAMIRVGYRTSVSGEICEDPYAAYNLTNALANGINVGVYFFSTAVSEAEAVEEANWVTSFISKYKITYPVAYNCEGFNDSENRQYSLSVDARSAIAMKFLATISSGGYTPMFYASKSEMENNSQWNTTSISSVYKVWVAWYPETPYPDTAAATYSGSHQMWQYTGNGTVPGISKPVDINVSYLGIASSGEASGGGNSSTENITVSPEADMVFNTVSETVTAKVEVNLRSRPSQDTGSTVLFALKNGETATRTGISESGWSRITYNGQTCYAVTSYLTTELTSATTSQTETETTFKNQFTDVNETVTPKDEVNLRSVPGVEGSEVIAAIKHGENVTRTGTSDLGWSRVIYNGQTLYCISSYLETVQ